MFEIKTLDFLHNISISTWHVTLVCQRPWDHRIPEKNTVLPKHNLRAPLNQFQSSPFNAKCLGKVQSPVQSVYVTSTNCKLQRKLSIPSVNLKNVEFGKWAQEKDRHTAKITIATWEVAKRKKLYLHDYRQYGRQTDETSATVFGFPPWRTGELFASVTWVSIGCIKLARTASILDLSSESSLMSCLFGPSIGKRGGVPEIGRSPLTAFISCDLWPNIVYVLSSGK